MTERRPSNCPTGHAAGIVTVAVNALMRQSMDSIKPFLDFLEEIQADYIIGDTGVLCLETRWLSIQNLYDTSTMNLLLVARSISGKTSRSFWGCFGSLNSICRIIRNDLRIFRFQQKSGLWCCIHRRNDLFFRSNTNFIQDRRICDQRSWSVLSRARRSPSHYSVYEDELETHIFSNNDLNMMTMSELVEHGFDHWKLDGVYCRVKLCQDYSTSSRPVIWFKMEHLSHRIKPICLMKKSQITSS